MSVRGMLSLTSQSLRTEEYFNHSLWREDIHAGQLVGQDSKKAVDVLVSMTDRQEIYLRTTTKMVIRQSPKHITNVADSANRPGNRVTALSARQEGDSTVGHAVG